MGLQKFRKNILNATHDLEFFAVSVFPDSSITLDIRVSVPTILVLKYLYFEMRGEITVFSHFK